LTRDARRAARDMQSGAARAPGPVTAPGAPARGRARIAMAGALMVAVAASPACAETLAERIDACLKCHGASGQSQEPLTPSLGGQPAFFLLTQLFLFREGRRENAPMIERTKGFTDGDLRAFSAELAKLPSPAPPTSAPDAARFARGRGLAAKWHCTVCHNPDLSGRDQMPRLANQREDYLVKALREFKRGTRIGYGGAMVSELTGLADAELLDLAHFLAHFPRPEPRVADGPRKAP
jgi:cytochrome c553